MVQFKCFGPLKEKGALHSKFAEACMHARLTLGLLETLLNLLNSLRKHSTEIETNCFLETYIIIIIRMINQG